MDIVPIGQEYTKTLKFRKPRPVFSTAPLWELVNEDGEILLSGTSIISQSQPDAWDVTFTIPLNYQSTSDDPLTLELYGNDSEGKVRAVEWQFNVMDAADDFLPSAVLAQDGEDIEDSLILDFDNITASSILATIQDYFGNKLAVNVQIQNLEVKRVANRSDVPDRFSEHEFRGYRYDFTIPGLTFPARTRSAYQIVYNIKSQTPKLKTTEVHQLFRLNSRFFDYIGKLKQYLDKARLVEIDPTLQWREDELANSLIEGINYINGHPAVYTFWTVDDIPLPMSSYVVQAAAFNALNARYLAEGFNDFEFQGLSTSLTIDRKQAISYKIEEIKAYLDTNLRNAKANAIATFGKGTPDESVTGATREARSLTRIQPSFVTNRRGSGFLHRNTRY